MKKFVLTGTDAWYNKLNKTFNSIDEVKKFIMNGFYEIGGMNIDNFCKNHCLAVNGVPIDSRKMFPPKQN